MRNCVRVARQTLTLFVWVQILVPQPVLRRTRFVLGSAFFYPLAHTAGHVFALFLYGVTPDPICFGVGLFLSLNPHRRPCFRFTFLRRDARPDLFWFGLFLSLLPKSITIPWFYPFRLLPTALPLFWQKVSLGTMTQPWFFWFVFPSPLEMENFI